MSKLSPQDIVARQLSSSLRGYPLWTPDPPRELLTHRPEGLRIGDVGVVVPGVGCFDVCFNLCLPPSHPFHQVTDVPDNFEPVVLSEGAVRTNINVEPRDKVITGELTSVQFLGIAKQPKDSSTRIKSPGLEYQFSLSSDEGAILILPEGADLVDLRNTDSFREAAMQHGADWYRFARKKLGQTLPPDSLYLITGLYKTRTWSQAAFDRIEETAVYPALFKNSPTIRRWETTRPRALEWGIGPVDNYGPPNQAVFIRGFKIALRSEMFGLRKWIEVMADDPSTERSPVSSRGGVPGSFVNFILGGHSAAWTTQSAGNDMQDEETTNSEDNGGEHAVNEHIMIQRVPEVSQPFHLSEVVNNYLLNKEPSANIAITHDDDWITMLRENQLQSEELAQGGRLETLISQRQYDITLKQGAVYLHRRSDSASQAGSHGSQPHRVQKGSESSDPNKHKSIDTQSASGVLRTGFSSPTESLFSRLGSGKGATSPLRPTSDSSLEDHSLPSYPYDALELEVPLSPTLNPTFSGRESPPPMGMSASMYGSFYEDHEPSPPGTGTSTSSDLSTVNMPQQGQASVKKRPQGRYEIGELYQCSWPDCTKAYSTLDYLNAHITMQKHGPKRRPNELKELRKQWRPRKKEETEARALEEAPRGSHYSSGPSTPRRSMPHPEPHQPTRDPPAPFYFPLQTISSLPQYSQAAGRPVALHHSSESSHKPFTEAFPSGSESDTISVSDDE